MGITKQEAAAARAQAAKSNEAKDRLSALEVERQGYVQRGDKKGVKAIDDEIAHWSKVARIPVESGIIPSKTSSGEPGAVDEQVQQLEQDLKEANATIERRAEEHSELVKTHADTIDELTQVRSRIKELEKELDELKAQQPEKAPQTPATPAQAAATSGGRAKAVAAAKD